TSFSTPSDINKDFVYNRIIESIIEANKNLVNYASTIEQLTISRERNRIARELHDLMAHTMSGVTIELEGASSMLSVDPEKTEKMLEHSLSAVRSGLMETRRALLALRSSQLEDLGLSLAIKNLVDTLPGKTEYQIDFEIDNIRVVLPANVEQCFYRVAQEALSNIVLHAKATRLSVYLKWQEELLLLSIKDNGVGFDKNNIVGTDKYGLLGMKERAEMIQANLSIESQLGVGTQIELKYRGSK
ncbi:MAG: sensor histidine kinase, partial [Methanobacterium sp.]